ncbi:MAG: hypothetical protein ACXU81_05175, partial [Myxococcaceae bacterium]
MRRSAVGRLLTGLAVLLAFSAGHVAAASDVRPAKISAAALRAALPGEQPWSRAMHCSMPELAQTWAGEGAVHCGDSGDGSTRNEGVECLMRAQDAHLPA